jgi:hypothetical protein
MVVIGTDDKSWSGSPQFKLLIVVHAFGIRPSLAVLIEFRVRRIPNWRSS